MKLFSNVRRSKDTKQNGEVIVDDQQPHLSSSNALRMGVTQTITEVQESLNNDQVQDSQEENRSSTHVDRSDSRLENTPMSIQEPSYTPPASADAIVNLPNLCVYSHNKEKIERTLNGLECGVCFDPLSEGVAITRLPCGHMYHVNCIIGWLLQNCTCPECRYELPTNDKLYEIGRQKRMKNRVEQSCSCRPPYHDCFLLPKTDMTNENDS